MLFLIFSCNQNSYSNAEIIWNEAIYNYENGDYTSCVLKLNDILLVVDTGPYDKTDVDGRDDIGMSSWVANHTNLFTGECSLNFFACPQFPVAGEQRWDKQ